MTDTSVEALRFRATVRHDGAEVGDLPYLEEFWAVRASDYATLLAERDRYKARAERAEEALREALKEGISEPGQRVYNMAVSALAQIDAEPVPDDFDDEAFTIAYLKGVADGKAEPHQPTVKPLTAEDREEIIKAAYDRMRENSRGARGQLITEWDGIESHVIVETERRILSALAEGDNQ